LPVSPARLRPFFSQCSVSSFSPFLLLPSAVDTPFFFFPSSDDRLEFGKTARKSTPDLPNSPPVRVLGSSPSNPKYFFSDELEVRLASPSTRNIRPSFPVFLLFPSFPPLRRFYDSTRKFCCLPYDAVPPVPFLVIKRVSSFLLTCSPPGDQAT